MSSDRELIERLAATRTVDLTTVGRRSGAAARIEIWWFRVDDRFVITGTPGRRDWYANVLKDDAVVIHTPFGDFPGRATPVTDPARRRQVMTDPALGWYSSQAELDTLLDSAPMIDLALDIERGAQS